MEALQQFAGYYTEQDLLLNLLHDELGVEISEEQVAAQDADAVAAQAVFGAVGDQKRPGLLLCAAVHPRKVPVLFDDDGGFHRAPPCAAGASVCRTACWTEKKEKWRPVTLSADA